VLQARQHCEIALINYRAANRFALGTESGLLICKDT
jgi:hypothetical protein